MSSTMESAPGVEPLDADAAWAILGEAGGHVHFVVDNFLRIRYVTPNVQGLIGHEAVVLQGASMLDVYHAEDLARIGDGYEAALYRGELVLARHRCKHADGRTVWVESTSRAVEQGPERLLVISLRREPGTPDIAWTAA